MTTYQRLKAENEQLRQEIFFLTTDDEQYLENKILTKLKYKIAFMIEETLYN